MKYNTDTEPLGHPARDEDTLLFALIELGAQLQQRIEDALEAVGLSLAKHGVLATLAEEGTSMPLGELAARQKCVRSNITQLVDRLETDGLVRRERDPDDRRSVRAALTAEGVTRQEAGREVVERARKAFLDSVPGADRAALGRIVRSFE
jgi:DNA-binding MarR family transcriptional regulator